MKSIYLNNIRSIKSIEAALWQIFNEPQSEFKLSASETKARHGAMHDASRLQMLVTLARRNSQGLLVLHEQSNVENSIQDLMSYAPGIAAVRLAKGVRVGDKIIDRREVLTAAVDKMNATDAEQYNSLITGRTIDLICVAASKVEFLRPLFFARTEKAVKEPRDMYLQMKKMLAVIAKKQASKIDIDFTRALGLFASELISNTQEHARSDHTGKLYPAHVEGLIFSLSSLNEELFSDDFKGNYHLNEYWKREISDTVGVEGKLNAIEISFFDSGPGLVGRYTGKLVTEMSLEEERTQLIKCLTHNITSKPGHFAGEGLPSVITALKKIGGLMRIRTGRMSIFNQFEPFDVKDDLFDFKDWNHEPLAPVDGAVVSFIVPIRDAS